MKCPECGEEMESEAPMSKMGERMSGRGVDDNTCMNPRCKYFGVKR